MLLRRFGSALALSVTLAAPPVWACINGMKQHNSGYAPDRPVAKKPKAPPKESDKLLKDANDKFLAGDWAAAKVVAGQAVQATEPGSLDHVRALRIAGESALKVKDYTRAEAWLQPLAAGPRATAYYKARYAEALVGLRSFERARDSLEPLARGDLMPDAPAWVALARARQATGNKAGAIDAVKSALERDAQNGEALALKGELEQVAPKPSAQPVKTSDRS
jgi:tetratricopeptide (TPR) repeat protein